MEKEQTLPWGKDGMTCALMMTVGHLHKIIKYTSNSYCWVFFIYRNQFLYGEHQKSNC